MVNVVKMLFILTLNKFTGAYTQVSEYRNTLDYLCWTIGLELMQ